jgi:hypothetical protein
LQELRRLKRTHWNGCSTPSGLAEVEESFGDVVANGFVMKYANYSKRRCGREEYR